MAGINQDSAVARALKTFAQFVIGLVIVVLNVPGVSDAIVTYVQQNFLTLVASVGIPTAFATFVWNFFRKDVPNV